MARGTGGGRLVLLVVRSCQLLAPSGLLQQPLPPPTIAAAAAAATTPPATAAALHIAVGVHKIGSVGAVANRVHAHDSTEACSYICRGRISIDDAVVTGARPPLPPSSYCGVPCETIKQAVGFEWVCVSS